MTQLTGSAQLNYLEMCTVIECYDTKKWNFINPIRPGVGWGVGTESAYTDFNLQETSLLFKQ